MPRATFTQSNFNGGEWTPLAAGRFDIAKYRTALAKCLNWMPQQQGGLTRRPGSIFVAPAKGTDLITGNGSFHLEDLGPRLIRFEFNSTQAYVLELGELYIRFYIDGGQLQTGTVAAYDGATGYTPGDLVSSGGTNYVCVKDVTGTAPPNVTYWHPLSGTILEIPTPWSNTEVWDLSFSQNADVVYFAHPSHPPMKLERFGATKWALTTVSFIDGPYLPSNTGNTTLTPSGTSGTVTVTASSTSGINNGQGFIASDVGRLIRMKLGGAWVWGPILTVTDTTHITVDLQISSAITVPRGATGYANLSGDQVTSVTITDGGSGYGTVPPKVNISPHPSDPATGTITVSAGVITGATITHTGSGYGAPSYPTVVINTSTGSGAVISATAFGVLISLNVLAGGSGYSPSDTITIVGGGTGGSGAAAYAQLTDGVVTGIIMTSGGSGYTPTPDVAIDAPSAVVVSSTALWQLGVWNSADGYPSTVGFHQNRLFWAGSSSYPGRIDGSNTGDYENMAPTQVDGTVTDSYAISYTLSSGVLDQIRWLLSDENGLLVGTTGAEWVVSPSTQQTALTPSNVNSKVLSNYGSANIPAIRLGKSSIFIQRDFRKVRELFYQFTYNTFQATDISLVSEHLTEGGIKQFDVQFSRQQIFWFVKNDGGLVAMTYDKDQDVCGWHPHEIGGYIDADKTQPPLVRSVCVVPRSDLLRDEIWLCVARYANGAYFETIELLSKPWEDGDIVSDSVFLDCSSRFLRSGAYVHEFLGGAVLSLDFEDAAGNQFQHGFKVGDAVQLTLDGDLASYSGSYTITTTPDEYTATVTLSPEPSPTPFVGNFTISSTAVYAPQLAGETVGVLFDGAVSPDITIDASGSGNLTVSGNKVLVGLRYSSEGKTMKIEAGGADGPAQGKLKRIHRVIFRFFQSVLLEIGSDDLSTGGFYPEPWRSSEDPMGAGLTPYTGDFRWSYEGDWGPDAQVSWRTTEPLPCNILMIGVQMDTEDDL